MPKIIEVKLLPSELGQEDVLRTRVLKQLRCAEEDLKSFRVVRRSVDARSRQPLFLLRVEDYLNETYEPEPALLDQLKMVDEAPEVIIVGAGPAGMFAAL